MNQQVNSQFYDGSRRNGQCKPACLRFKLWWLDDLVRTSPRWQVLWGVPMQCLSMSLVQGRTTGEPSDTVISAQGWFWHVGTSARQGQPPGPIKQQSYCSINCWKSSYCILVMHRWAPTSSESAYMLISSTRHAFSWFGGSVAQHHRGFHWSLPPNYYFLRVRGLHGHFAPPVLYTLL